jgi:hypothetical protein
MAIPDRTAAREIPTLPHRQPEWLPPADYNYEHFRTRHLMMDVAGTLRTRGVPPGEPAPEFSLIVAGGGRLRLSDLRGQPTLLHFGSYT